MAIRRNRYYNGANDPALAKAFDNIASMFKPPGGSEVLGYVKARQVRDEMERQSAAYGNIQRGDLSAANLIGMGVSNPVEQAGLADLYSRAGRTSDPRTLDTFNYALRGNAGNTFTGLDTNNAARLDQERIQQKGALDREMVGRKLGMNERSLGLPPAIAGLYNVPSEPQVGVLELDQGKEYRLPDGKIASGPAKPLNESEVRGQILSRQDQRIQDVILRSAAPVEKVVDSAGTPRIQYRSEAVGQEAYEKPTAEKAQNYVDPEGRRGISYDGGRTDGRTGRPLPTGTVLSSPQAGVGDTALGPTKTNISEANQREASVRQTRGMLDLYEGLLSNNPGAVGIPGLIRGTAQNAVQVANDLARSFGKDAPAVQEAAAGIREGMSKVAPEFFDPAIPEAQFYQGALAYALARTENPRGEVSRQAYDRAFERVRGGQLQNTTSAQAAIGAFRKMLDQEEVAIRSLRGQVRESGTPGGSTPDAARPQQGQTAPVEGARQAQDGNWYVPDPNRPGKYLMVQPNG